MRHFFLVQVVILSVTGKETLRTNSDGDSSTKVATEAARKNRIYGGRDTLIEKVPWQVSLMVNGGHVCGAVILSKTKLITAAHCCLRKGSYEIRAGSSVHQGGKVVGVSSCIIHERYKQDRWTKSNDIAIVVLSSPLNFSNRIKPISLPNHEQNFDNMTCLVSGWGRTCDSCLHSVARVLKAAFIRVLPEEECKTRFEFDRRITLDFSQICIFGDGKGRGSCMGDSGGPLVCTVDSQVYLAGVTSWVFANRKHHICYTEYPGVYTRISEFLPWISSNLVI